MICMRKFSKHEKAFLNAVSLLVERDWKGKKGLFADLAGISGGYLSEIIGKRKCPKIDKQENIAEKLGFGSLMEFIEYGKTVKQEDMIAVIPKAKIKDNESPIQATATMPSFNVTTHTTPPPKRRKTDIEIQAGKNHQELVGRFEFKEVAIEINRTLLEIEKIGGRDEMIKAQGALEDRLKDIIKKNGLIDNGTEGK